MKGNRILLTFFALFFVAVQANETKIAVETFEKKISVKEEKKPSVSRDALPEWTVLIFIEGRNNLNSFAKKNIQDMAQVGSNDNLNILVQWYQPYEPIWRYKIDKNKVTPISIVEPAQKNDFEGDLVNSMSWAVNSYPAKKYALVLWNHGLGITDPVWNMPQSGSTHALMSSQDFFGGFGGNLHLTARGDNPRTEIDGVTNVQQDAQSEIKLSNDDRGILFNEIDRAYMNNQAMVRAFTNIKDKVLGGNKIDLVGMDACLMAMAEVAYQIRNCAKYFVGSEEVELAQGWNYGPILSGMAGTALSPDEVARLVVLSFEDYFKPRTYLYTQSAIDLSLIDGVKANIDQMVMAVQACKQIDAASMRRKIVNARRLCQQFSTPTFVDLHSFYSELYRQLDAQLTNDKHIQKTNQTKYPNYHHKPHYPIRDDSQGQSYDALKQILASGMKIIEGAVLANVNGPYLTRSKGLSIYFPCGRIDNSYPITDFARDCLWGQFIKDTLNGN